MFPRFIFPVKHLKNMGQGFAADSHTSITHLNHQIFALRSGTKGDCAAGRYELYSIIEDIPEHPGHLAKITSYRRHIRIKILNDVEILRLNRFAQSVLNGSHHPTKVNVVND